MTVVPGAAGAFGIFFLRQFLRALSVELEEAAGIDGANQWQIFRQVVISNAKAALATLAVLSFLTLERLYLADLRAVQPGAAHAACRSEVVARRLRHRLSGHHGRRVCGERPSVDPVRVYAAVHHRAGSSACPRMILLVRRRYNTA